MITIKTFLPTETPTRYIPQIHVLTRELLNHEMKGYKDADEYALASKMFQLDTHTVESVTDSLLAETTSFLMLDDDKVIGYASFTAAHNAELISMVIDKDRQCQGHGRALFEAVLEHAKTNCPGKLMHVSCQSNNPSLAAWKRFGLKERVIGLYCEL